MGTEYQVSSAGVEEVSTVQGITGNLTLQPAPGSGDAVLIKDSTGTTVITVQSGTATLPATAAVASIHADSNANLTGAVQLVSGTNITLSQTGQDITINASGGGGSPAGSNTQIQYNNSGAFGASANLTFDGTTLAVGEASINSSTGAVSFDNASITSDGSGNVSATSLTLTGFLSTDGGLIISNGAGQLTLTGGLNVGSYIPGPYLPDTIYSKNSVLRGVQFYDSSGDFIVGFTGQSATELVTDFGNGTGANWWIGDYTDYHANANGPSLFINGYAPDEIFNVGIFTTTPDRSAALVVGGQNPNGNYVGFLPPTMTSTNRTSISSPAEGLIVYDTTLFQLWEIQNGTWTEIGGGSGSPGGADTAVQYNSNGGTFGGDTTNFNWNDSTFILNIGAGQPFNTTGQGDLSVYGSISTDSIPGGSGNPAIYSDGSGNLIIGPGSLTLQSGAALLVQANQVSDHIGIYNSGGQIVTQSIEYPTAANGLVDPVQSTVDLYVVGTDGNNGNSHILIKSTTADVYTLATPTTQNSDGRVLYILHNTTSTGTLTVAGVSIPVGSAAQWMWDYATSAWYSVG